MAFQTPDCVATAGGDLPGSCSMVSLYPLGDAFPSAFAFQALAVADPKVGSHAFEHGPWTTN